MTMTETLGMRIAQRRRMLSLSQEAFGEKMGVSRQAISKWESDAAIPEVDRLIEMSKLFEVSVGWLLGTECEEEMPLVDFVIPVAPDIPEPLPTKPSADSGPQPEKEQPVHQNFGWLSVVCCLVAVVSLALSVFAFWQADGKEDSTPMPQSYDDLLEQVSELQKSLDYYEKYSERIYKSNIELSMQALENKDLIEGLTSYVYTMPDASGLVEGPDKLPQFSAWNLVGSSKDKFSSVEVVFSCVPNNPEVAYMIMEVFHGEESVVSALCYFSESMHTYYLAVDLEPRNDYRYVVEIQYLDGTGEKVELTGHKMSNLLDGVQPELQATRVSDTQSYSAGVITVAYSDIVLKKPVLMPHGNCWRFQTLRLAHYQDGELKATHDLTEFMQTLYLKERGQELEFSLAERTFATLDTKDGAVHEIRLEGEADLDWSGERTDSYSYSVVLEAWENVDGELKILGSSEI